MFLSSTIMFFDLDFFYFFYFLCHNQYRQDRARAIEILMKDLKVFASFNQELFKEITLLLTLGNFRYYSILYCL